MCRMEILFTMKYQNYQCDENQSNLDVLNERNMMTSLNRNIFRGTGPLWGESNGHRWIPATEASVAELWCFLWYAPVQTRRMWSETPYRSSWRHCNAFCTMMHLRPHSYRMLVSHLDFCWHGTCFLMATFGSTFPLLFHFVNSLQLPPMNN